MTAPAPVHLGINCSAGFLGDPVRYEQKFIKKRAASANFFWRFFIEIILFCFASYLISGTTASDKRGQAVRTRCSVDNWKPESVE